MYRIGDLVTRKSYDNDIVFKIMDIVDDFYIFSPQNFYNSKNCCIFAPDFKI